MVPWRIKAGAETLDQIVTPGICTNDEALELDAVLSGEYLGQLAGVTAASYIRAKQLIPLLVETIPERSSYFVYYGSRNSQPARARAFIDLTLERLVHNERYVLSDKELKAGSRPKKRS